MEKGPPDCPVHYPTAVRVLFLLPSERPQPDCAAYACWQIIAALLFVAKGEPAICPLAPRTLYVSISTEVLATCRGGAQWVWPESIVRSS